MFVTLGSLNSYAADVPEEEAAGVQDKRQREAWSVPVESAEEKEVSSKQRTVDQVVEEFQAQLAKRRVLVFDGGGVRGALTAQLLVSLEEKLQKIAGKRISEFFQGSITGTSTGSFIALALVSPDKKGQKGAGPYTALEVASFYTDRAHRMFSGCCAFDNCMGSCRAACTAPRTLRHIFKSIVSCFGCCGACYGCFGVCGPRYSRLALDEEIGALLGRDVPLERAKSNVQVTTYDISPGGTFLYLSSTSSETNKYTFDEAASASSAAPGYFPAAPIGGRPGVPKRLCVDGGLFDNSPTLAAIKQAKLSIGGNVGVENFTVLSIGTGQAAGAFDDESLRFAGVLSWAAPAIDIGMDGTRDAEDSSFESILSENYFRVKISLKDRWLSMDNPRNVEPLVKTASDEAAGSFKTFFDKIEAENKFMEAFRKLCYAADGVESVWNIMARFQELVGSTHEETNQRLQKLADVPNTDQKEVAFATQVALNFNDARLLSILKAAILSVERGLGSLTQVQPL